MWWDAGAPEPQRDEIHLWRAPLDLPALAVRTLESTLSPDEQARGDGFRFSRDRDRFRVARGILRSVLAPYLGKDPAAIHFSYGPYGKPALSGETGPAALGFSLSHSHGLVLIALSSGIEVGVDLERVPSDWHETVAERILPAEEVSVLRNLPPIARAEAFAAAWTLREACAKARGKGLATLLADAGDLPARSTPRCETRAWSARTLSPSPGFIAAVVAEGNDWRIRAWEWHGHFLERPQGRPGGRLWRRTPIQTVGAHPSQVLLGAIHGWTEYARSVEGGRSYRSVEG